MTEPRLDAGQRRSLEEGRIEVTLRPGPSGYCLRPQELDHLMTTWENGLEREEFKLQFTGSVFLNGRDILAVEFYTPADCKLQFEELWERKQYEALSGGED